MTHLLKFASRGLKAAGIGLISLAIALPVTAQRANAQTIAEIAGSNDSFDVLVALLNHAGWTGSFANESKEFTVFAPTDDAFGRLPKGTIEALYQPENREVLYEILANHIVGGTVTSDQLSSGAVETKSGNTVQINVGSQVTVDDATVTAADIAASNGVIHVVDAVLIPADL